MPQRSRKTVKPSRRFRPALFWDVNVKTIDTKKNARYIIERILDFGNDKEVHWMAQKYPPRLIRDTLEKSRVVHDKSKALWSLIFH